MSYLTDLREEDNQPLLTPEHWDALRLAAYFPTDDQLQSLAMDLHIETSSDKWFQRQVGLIFDLIADPARIDQLSRHLQQLGLDASVVQEILLSGRDHQKGRGLSDRKRRDFLGALYWAHLAEERRSGRTDEDIGFEQPRFAEALYLPARILDASLVQGWRYDQPAGSDIETKIVGRKLWNDGERALADDVWATLVGADDTPTLFRLRSYHQVRVETLLRAAVHLDLEETNYRAFQGTNNVFQVADKRFAERAWGLGLGHAEKVSPADLRDSRLCNPLSVTCIAYGYERPGSRRRMMLIQNRNYGKVHSGKYRFQATAGGFTTVAADTGRDDRPHEGANPDPFFTIQREFGEEAFRLPEVPEGRRASAIQLADVTLLALVRDVASCWEVGLVGEIELPFTRQDFWEGRVVYGTDIAFESQWSDGEEPIEWVEATPVGLALWLAERDAGVGDFMPFGLAAIMLSFYKQGFSLEEIHDALQPVAGPGLRHLVMKADPGWTDDKPPRPDLTRRIRPSATPG